MRSVWSLVGLILCAAPVVAAQQPAVAPPPPALSLSCPAAVTIQAGDGNTALVTFPAPTSTGGVAPITIVTTPNSGGAFEIGTTRVTGTAIDGAGQKASCTFSVTVNGTRPAAAAAARPPATTTQPSGIVFSNGFEGDAPLGCTLEGLLQRTTAQPWDDFGPHVGATCASGRQIAEIVEGNSCEGSRSMQVNFRPDGSQNGPDYRVIKTFGSQNEIWARWCTRYSKNWVFAGADHKVAIFGNSQGTSQDVYFNIRGNGNGPVGRPVIGITPGDSMFSDEGVQIRGGDWIVFEIHIVCGPSGRVEAKINGRQLKLRNEAGSLQNINKLDPCTGDVGYIKLDTTYNAYNYPSRLGLTMNMWYDDIAVSAGGWIGR